MVSIAPATPCSTRAVISIAVLGAIAASSDAAANPATPDTNSRQRP